MPHLPLSVVIRRFPGERTGSYLPFDLALELVESTRQYLEEHGFISAVDQALDDCQVNDREMRCVAKSVLASYMGRHGAVKAAAHRDVMRTVTAIYRERRNMERWLMAHEVHEDTHPVGDSPCENIFVVEPEYRHPDYQEVVSKLSNERTQRPRIKMAIDQSGQYRLAANGFGRTKLPPMRRRKATVRRARRKLKKEFPAVFLPELPLHLHV